MMELYILTGLTVLVLAVSWRTGVVSTVLSFGAYGLDKTSAVITDDDGSWGYLPEQLQYRDFLPNDVVETAGWLWAGTGVILPSSDGIGNAGINMLSESNNRILSGLPANTWLQTIHHVIASPEEIKHVLERIGNQSKDDVWKAVYEARAEFLSNEAHAGRLKLHVTYVFVGREGNKRRLLRWRIRDLWSASPWISNERRELEALAKEVIRTRASFQNYMKATGAHFFNVSSQEVLRMAYERLNKERSKKHPCPLYQWDVNPRELICFTPVEILKAEGCLRVGNQYTTTISLHRLPTKTASTFMEKLTRNEGLTLDYEISVHVKTGDRVKDDEKLGTEKEKLINSLVQSRVANKVEEKKAEQIDNIQSEMMDGEEVLCVLGFGITLFATSIEELNRRVDLVLTALRECKGMEGIVDTHALLTQHLSTLPCIPHKDARTKPCMSRDAAAMSGWTSGPSGMSLEKSTLFFQRPDGGVFGFDQVSRDFNSGMALISGMSGSGKSVILNLLRSDHLARGNRGLGIDYRTSSKRLAALAGGEIIDITDVRGSKGLGIFDIYPKADDHYEPHELVEGLLPKDRLVGIEEMIESLCLDPKRPSETSLDPVLSAFLREQIVTKTYLNNPGVVPSINDFIRRAKNVLHKHRQYGDEIAGRLSIYAKNASLGRFFNNDAEPIDVTNPYLMFDFGKAKGDPRLLLVASLAINTYLMRWVRKDPHKKKFFHVDELQVVSEYPLIRKAIDQAVRTVRKENVHCIVGSQDPRDFEGEEFHSIRINCEVMWLFQMPAELARSVFNVPVGIANLIANLKNGGDEFRECALVYPGGCARLRLRFGPVDGRLFMEASTGNEKFSAIDAISAVPGPVPERLWNALQISRDAAEVPLNEVWKIA
jgi:hypothetical protein